MNKQNKKINAALDRFKNFSPRGDNCPICGASFGASFRHGCDHSVQQAKDRLFQRYIEAIVNNSKN